jgi:exonuclease III
MIKSHKLIDIWRQAKKIKTQFTWNRKDKSEATRIDYFLGNQNKICRFPQHVLITSFHTLK